MGLLTYKVFNLYSFIWCGTYNSHLHTTTLPLKCESINSSCPPFKGKLLLACIAVAGFSATDRLASVVLFVERGSDTSVESLGVAMGTAHIEATQTTSKRDATLLPKTLRQWVYGLLDGSLGEAPGGPFTSRLEQPHKQERHHTLTQILKAMSLWIFLLIKCSTFTLLSDVGHITHTYTQQHIVRSLILFFTQKAIFIIWTSSHDNNFIVQSRFLYHQSKHTLKEYKKKQNWLDCWLNNFQSLQIHTTILSLVSVTWVVVIVKDSKS